VLVLVLLVLVLVLLVLVLVLLVLVLVLVVLLIFPGGALPGWNYEGRRRGGRRLLRRY
jgi:hypothetical protein